MTGITEELVKLVEELVLQPERGREGKEITMAMAYGKEQYSSATTLVEP